jgi:septal ring factor EnvC (AmiA/AmiB activator)
MTADSGESEGGGTEEKEGSVPGMTPLPPSEETPTAQAPEVSSVAPPAPPRAGGRRTQLKIVRENIRSLSKELGSFRKSHELSTKKLEAHMATLRKDLAKHIRSKDFGDHVKVHEADIKRLEKQMGKLRNELVSFKKEMAKDTAKSRAREEAALSRFVKKVKKAKPSKKPRAKHSKTKR